MAFESYVFYLLDFVYQHNPNLIYKISEPVLESNSKKLILANHSLKQLYFLYFLKEKCKKKFFFV